MKKIIIIILSFLMLIFICFIAYITIANKSKVAILGYHSIMPHKINTSGDMLVVDQEKFEKELQLLDKLGYKTLTLDEYYCWKNKTCKIKGKKVLITFDDGYYNNYDYAYSLLKKYHMNATVFIVGEYALANDTIHMNMETINKIYEEYPNVEVASHTYAMHYHSEKKYDEVMDDAAKMKELIPSQYFAYPFGDNTDEYIKALKDSGYKMAFTFGPGREHRKSDMKDDNYLVPRLNISNDMPMWKFILRLILPM